MVIAIQRNEISVLRMVIRTRNRYPRLQLRAPRGALGDRSAYMGQLSLGAIDRITIQVQVDGPSQRITARLCASLGAQGAELSASPLPETLPNTK